MEDRHFLEESAQEERRRGWIEVALVVGLTVPLVLATATGSASIASFVADSVSDLSFNLPLVGLILYLMWRSEWTWEHFGLSKLFDADGIGTFLAVLIAVAGIGPFLALGFDSAWPPSEVETNRILMAIRTPATAGQWIVYLPSLLVGAAFEELVLRGFLTVRLNDLIGKKIVAVVVPAALSGAMALYYGVSAGLAGMLLGLILGAMMLSTRRLGPMIIARIVGSLFMAFFPEVYNLVG